jgi:hypothetical protein
VLVAVALLLLAHLWLDAAVLSAHIEERVCEKGGSLSNFGVVFHGRDLNSESPKRRSRYDGPSALP